EHLTVRVPKLGILAGQRDGLERDAGAAAVGELDHVSVVRSAVGRGAHVPHTGRVLKCLPNAHAGLARLGVQVRVTREDDRVAARTQVDVVAQLYEVRAA